MFFFYLSEFCFQFHFEGTNVGRRFLRSKFAVEDLDDSDKFQETLKNQTSNNEFIKELLTYGITNSRKKKPKASQHVNVEVPAISSIAGPTPNACDDFMKTIESKYVGQHSVNVFLLINTPAEYRCREINRSWVDDLKNNIKLAPGGHVTVLPVLIDPKQVSSADAFQKESMLDNNMFLLGGNHLTTACQEILAEEQVNDTFRKYRKVLVDVYVGLERTEALLLGNLHNSRTKTLKMMFQDKVIQARQIFLAKEDDIHVNWKDTATDVFGKIEKKSYSKEGLGTVLSVAEYSEEAFTEVLRIFKNWPEQEVPQKIFRSLQGIESSCLVSYLKMVDSSVSINTVSGLIETEKKKAQLKKIFINITESEDWEEAELLYEQHTSKIDDFLDINLKKGHVPTMFVEYCMEAKDLRLRREDDFCISINVNVNGKAIVVDKNVQNLLSKYKRKINTDLKKISKKIKVIDNLDCSQLTSSSLQSTQPTSSSTEQSTQHVVTSESTQQSTQSQLLFNEQ
ncbi:Hypothetical predicted protein [Mytilus galloprovincialis]|uniref:Uncharacterized protein n=1 Tax=Mytilus galloprovincialis TaxID=29158 RepID=A0A8B6FR61_MYTGA|nr:Hypothetical predicted protein [Mytilus galloprovincialis]